MNILSWLIFGAIVGIIAYAIDPADESKSVLGSIILGIVGAVVGGYIANLIFGLTITGFNVSSFLLAIFGSLLLLFVGNAVRKA